VAGRQPVLALLMRLLCAAALVVAAVGAHAAVILTSLHSFGVFTNGANPEAALVQGSDGSFYGTTSGGGTNGGSGTVLKISTNGVLTSLYSFKGGNDGRTPQAGLVQGSDGMLYGTTYNGGTNDAGTVFKISTNGVLTSLYSFTGGNDGRTRQAGLVQGSDGYFYGTTAGLDNGLEFYPGTVFRISTNGVLSTLYSFPGSNDGANPQAGLVQGSDGMLYGTTRTGGTNGGYGTVFKISANGTLTTLYSFGSVQDRNFDALDGAGPSGLVQGSDGMLYGTTYNGGTNDAGTVFKISSNGALTSLYSFTGFTGGSNPNAGLVQDSDGNFYGTTQSGGTTNYNPDTGLYGYGTVFKISSNGALTSLHSFAGGDDGANPVAALVLGSDGSFYGTTQYGGTMNYNPQTGTYGSGTVFKIRTNGVLTSLYSFPGSNDGANPQAGLVQGSDGNFYGTTVNGGTNDAGTVFKISSNGALTSLYSFTGSNDGAYPYAGLVQGSDGYFYGTTQSGGTTNYNPDTGLYGYGTVFKISSNGALTSLYSFTGGNDGAYPYGGLVQGSDGYFYGTTYRGGAYRDQYGEGYGTVFKISTSGALTSLHSFNNTNGANPIAGLVQGSDGFFYGTTYGGGTNGGYLTFVLGTVFKISSNGALTSLYSFTGFTDGYWPDAGLVQGSDGNLYGTTLYGGTNDAGTVFKISTNGTLTSLYSFTRGNDGWSPQAGLVQGSDGNFYGTTPSSAYYRIFGTVFKISTNGALTTLYSFTGGNNGGNAQVAMVQGSDGSFYGTTSSGGAGGAGTVFRLTIVPQPQLTIIPSEPYVILTWPTNYSGFTLQSTTNLGSSAVWTTNSSPPVVIGGDNVVINAASGKRQFYRLSQ
jgi:uncharacterized repeat protein (TIGR03803 family)